MDTIKQTLSNHGYEFIDFIGEGASAKVYLCKSKQYNNLFAIKRVFKEKLAQQEISSLISLIHPYVVKLYSTFHDDCFQYLVMEYCQNGTLKNKIINHDRFLRFAKELLEVLQYCHSQKIAHRDIKPENIFVDQFDNVKLGDFGFSNKFEEDETAHKKCGSLMYCSPEVLSTTQFDPFKADIWSLGITFFYLITGEFPFSFTSSKKLREAIIFSTINYDNFDIDPEIKFLVMKMTLKNPLNRPSANQLLNFPIFNPKIPKRISKSISISSMHFTSNQKSSSKNKNLDIKTSDTFSNSNISDTLSSDYNHEDDNLGKDSLQIKKIHSFLSFNLNYNTTCHKHYRKYD